MSAEGKNVIHHLSEHDSMYEILWGFMKYDFSGYSWLRIN